MNKEITRVVWITGASSGVGAALGEYYAQAGTVLALLARREVELKNVSDKCRAKGAVVHEYVADVTSIEAVRKCVNDFLTQVDHVDIVIANAGIRGEEDQDCQDTYIAEEVMRVNYFGVINTFSPFIKQMKAIGQGQLVAISSIASFRGTPNSGAYSASKAAVNVWTESLRLRLMPHGVNVTTIGLGFVNTAMTSDLPFWMPGILSPQKAAMLIANAIKSKARLPIIPWQSRIIWNGFRILPGLIYDKSILLAKAYGPKR
jgi:short-subunit dehydrogenase